MTGVGIEPTTYGLKGRKLAPVSAGGRQFSLVLLVLALTSASQRWWVLSPPLSPRPRSWLYSYLLQQRLEARAVAEGVPRWIQAEPGGGEFATPSLLVDGVRRW